MLVIMADLLSISVGDLFVGAVVPGLLLSGLYFAYIFDRGHPEAARCAPRCPPTRPRRRRELAVLVVRGFIPPVLLIVLVLGSIFAGFATPTEAAGVGAIGATLLAIANGAELPDPEGRLHPLGADRRHAVRHLHRRDLLLLRLQVAARRPHDHRAGAVGRPRPLGRAGRPDGHGLRARLLLRLDRDHADRAAGLRADRRGARLRPARPDQRRCSTGSRSCSRSTCRPRS